MCDCIYIVPEQIIKIKEEMNPALMWIKYVVCTMDLIDGLGYNITTGECV